MEYKIVSAFNPGALESEVAALLADGWRPVGGLVALDNKGAQRDYSDGEMLFYQAMTREQITISHSMDVAPKP